MQSLKRSLDIIKTILLSNMQSPYLKRDEACVYCRRKDVAKFSKWIEGLGVKRKNNGKHILYAIADIELVLNEEWQPSRNEVKATSSNGVREVDNIVNPLAQFQKPKRKG